MFTTIKNNGQYKHYTNKCFFIALKDAMSQQGIDFALDYWITASKLGVNAVFDNFNINTHFIDDICACYEVSIYVYTNNGLRACYGENYKKIIKIMYVNSHFEAIIADSKKPTVNSESSIPPIKPVNHKTPLKPTKHVSFAPEKQVFFFKSEYESVSNFNDNKTKNTVAPRDTSFKSDPPRFRSSDVVRSVKTNNVMPSVRIGTQNIDNRMTTLVVPKHVEPKSNFVRPRGPPKNVFEIPNTTTGVPNKSAIFMDETLIKQKLAIIVNKR